MIISRAPVRITLGGGGTDLPSYYTKFGGFVMGAAVNKYVFICANRRFYDTIRLSYSETEIVEQVDSIKHRIFREALKMQGIGRGIELVSIADVPANCGLGSSSAFTVALLNALHAYKREFVGQKQLAEEACYLEMDVLGEPIGKQDQYLSAFGGITCLTIDKSGEVFVEPLNASPETIEQLENNLLFFHTGIERKASDVLLDQDQKSKKEDPAMIENLHVTKEIGFMAKSALEKGDVNAFGELLHVHWENKKKRTAAISDPFIDECYEVALRNGALGGKIVGAGGGGFFMFYCYNSQKPKLSEAMKSLGLKPMPFHFDFEGAKVLLNT